MGITEQPPPRLSYLRFSLPFDAGWPVQLIVGWPGALDFNFNHLANNMDWIRVPGTRVRDCNPYRCSMGITCCTCLKMSYTFIKIVANLTCTIWRRYYLFCTTHRFLIVKMFWGTLICIFPQSAPSMQYYMAEWRWFVWQNMTSVG